MSAVQYALAKETPRRQLDTVWAEFSHCTAMHYLASNQIYE